MAKKTFMDKAIESLEAEIVPLQQQIDIRRAAIGKLRDQNVIVRRQRKAKKADAVEAPREMASAR